MKTNCVGQMLRMVGLVDADSKNSSRSVIPIDIPIRKVCRWDDYSNLLASRDWLNLLRRSRSFIYLTFYFCIVIYLSFHFCISWFLLGALWTTCDQDKFWGFARGKTKIMPQEDRERGGEEERKNRKLVGNVEEIWKSDRTWSWELESRLVFSNGQVRIISFVHQHAKGSNPKQWFNPLLHLHNCPTNAAFQQQSIPRYGPRKEICKETTHGREWLGWDLGSVGIWRHPFWPCLSSMKSIKRKLCLSLNASASDLRS